MKPTSSYQVSIQSDVDCPVQLESAIKMAVFTALRKESAAPLSAVAILLTSDQKIQEMNRDFRGFDSVTDVLSFPVGETLPGMEEVAFHLGDLVIALPYATQQAEASGHGAAEEMQLLAVHGTLHLLGYDHADAEEKERMWRAQSDIMAELDLAHVLPSERDHA